MQSVKQFLSTLFTSEAARKAAEEATKKAAEEAAKNQGYMQKIIQSLPELGIQNRLFGDNGVLTYFQNAAGGVASLPSMIQKYSSEKWQSIKDSDLLKQLPSTFDASNPVHVGSAIALVAGIGATGYALMRSRANKEADAAEKRGDKKAARQAREDARALAEQEQLAVELEKMQKMTEEAEYREMLENPDLIKAMLEDHPELFVDAPPEVLESLRTLSSQKSEPRLVQPSLVKPVEPVEPFEPVDLIPEENDVTPIVDSGIKARSAALRQSSTGTLAPVTQIAPADAGAATKDSDSKQRTILFITLGFAVLAAIAAFIAMRNN